MNGIEEHIKRMKRLKYNIRKSKECFNNGERYYIEYTIRGSKNYA